MEGSRNVSRFSEAVLYIVSHFSSFSERFARARSSFSLASNQRSTILKTLGVRAEGLTALQPFEDPLYRPLTIESEGPDRRQWKGKTAAEAPVLVATTRVWSFRNRKHSAQIAARCELRRAAFVVAEVVLPAAAL